MHPTPVWDHVVINTQDRTDEAVAAFEKLGFTMTPRGYHSMGSINNLAIFGTDYLELIGIPPGGNDERLGLFRFPRGLNGLVFGTDASHEVAAAAEAAGLPLQPPREFSRPVDLGGGVMEDAKFRTINLAAGAVDYGRVYFCHHYTRHLVWRDEWRRHRNGALGIARAMIISSDADKTAEVYRKLFGNEMVSRVAGGFTLAVGLSRLDGVDEGEARKQFGDAGWECPQMLDALDDADDLYFDVVSQIKMDHWSRGRVGLIGDAAGCISLLGGEGTGLAMTEAYVLAGELDRARGDHREAFEAYEALMHPFVASKQAGAARFVGFFATRTKFGLWLRNIVMRAMNVGPVLRLVAGDIRDDLELPQYAI